MHPGRSARSPLRMTAATHNISRVSGLIEMSGPGGTATQRVRGFPRHEPTPGYRRRTRGQSQRAVDTDILSDATAPNNAA